MAGGRLHLFPVAFVLSIVFLIAPGMPMTFQSDYQVNTLEPTAMGTVANNQPKQQTIVVGPLRGVRADEDAGHQRRGLLRDELSSSV